MARTTKAQIVLKELDTQIQKAEFELRSCRELVRSAEAVVVALRDARDRVEIGLNRPKSQSVPSAGRKSKPKSVEIPSIQSSVGDQANVSSATGD